MTDLRTPASATAFDLEELRQEYGRIVVRGRWSGTRGMRFVRPTLLVGDREVLATLDHKPWAPDGGPVWTAAFPWKGPEIDAADAALAVTPAVTVPLVPGRGPAADDVVAPRREAPPAGRAAVAPARDRGEAPVQRAVDREPAPTSTAGAAVIPVDVPAPEPVPEFAVEQSDPSAEAGRELAALRRRLEHAERERDDAIRTQRLLREEADDAQTARRSAELARDDALGERRRAEGWAEQQKRHVVQVQRESERVGAERDAALAARGAAERERDDAVRQAAQAREARDEALVAYRALERRSRVGDEPPTVERPATTQVEPDAEVAEDEPLGVVAVPHARDLAADVHHVDRLSARPVTTFDLWAVRILGSVAAVCFLGLLLLLMLTFT